MCQIGLALIFGSAKNSGIYDKKYKMRKMKPRTLDVMKVNMRVKCPHCGQTNTIPKSDRFFACRRCRQSIDLDKKYRVDKYY